MSKADIVAAILWAGATLYAVFGGADFGAGIVTLFTPRERELGGRLRARIGHSLGPVWEANHVWLIFCLVVLWTAFPKAFGPIMETLYVPLALAALGIVLRGSGFAFGHAFTGRAHDRAERVFAVASLMTPFFMGCVVGSIASGEVGAGGSPGALDWIDWLPIVVGLMFVASSAYLASVFLVVDAGHAGEDDTREWFRRSAIAWAIAAGVLAIAGLVALDGQASYIADRLRAEGLPLMIASLLLGGLALTGLLARRRRGLRPLAVGAVVTVIWGWGVAQFPYLLPTTLTISAGAGAEPTLTAVIVVFGFALAIVGPALIFLYRLSQAQVLE
jgi:cytochrome bd ubiquinol oxidase subunit II